MQDLLPAPELFEILLPAYRPCPGFAGPCHGVARWEPGVGHVPRGFLGALGALQDVKLVVISAEPGDPYAGDRYDVSRGEKNVLSQICAETFSIIDRRTDPYHQNLRYILDSCFPNMSFHEQLKHVWLTESVLCSAPKETGVVPTQVERNCRTNFLAKQLALFPNAVVAAFGGKAQKRAKGIPNVIAAKSLSPPGCNQRDAKAGWDAVIAALKKRA